jgi:L-ascorbate metabolism protein UlaG (beta-lactamase superfamily)
LCLVSQDKRPPTYWGYNGYVLEGNNRRVIFSGDTALCDSFAELRTLGPIDVAIMPIGAYNPWIHSHCTPEQAVQMANDTRPGRKTAALESRTP